VTRRPARARGGDAGARWRAARPGLEVRRRHGAQLGRGLWSGGDGAQRGRGWWCGARWRVGSFVIQGVRAEWPALRAGGVARPPWQRGERVSGPNVGSIASIRPAARRGRDRSHTARHIGGPCANDAPEPCEWHLTRDIRGLPAIGSDPERRFGPETPRAPPHTPSHTTGAGAATSLSRPGCRTHGARTPGASALDAANAGPHAANALRVAPNPRYTRVTCHRQQPRAAIRPRITPRAVPNAALPHHPSLRRVHLALVVLQHARGAELR
jgi:hypothetical protein